MTERLAATRSQLLRSRARLDRVVHGIDLLTRKRRALAAELFRVATPAIEARSRVAARAAEAYPALVMARAALGDAELGALAWPTRAVEIEVEAFESWGVSAGAVRRLTPVRRSWQARGQSPGLTGPSAASAASSFEDLVELLLDAASTEILLRRLAHELQRTSRQVNMLERRVAPALRAELRRVRTLLEEREREDHVRLVHLGNRRAARTPVPD